MNCEAFENRIQSLLDEREDLSIDSVLTSHADLCEPCARSFDQFVDLQRGLEQLGVPYDAPDMAIGIVTPLAIHEAPLSVPWSRWMMALAAALFAALIPVSLYFLGDSGSSSSNLAAVDLELSNTAVGEAAPESDSKVKSIDAYPVIDERMSRDILFALNRIPGEIDNRLDTLEPYYRYAELPGLFPVASSLNRTVDWIRWSLEKQNQSDTSPDLGRYDYSRGTIA